jgi:predicted ATPase
VLTSNIDTTQNTYRINKFGIKGFRRLFDIDISMPPFSVIIGINGVGKTTFLDVFSLLSASASGNLDFMLSIFGGVSNILTRGKSEKISFSINMEIPGYKPLEYSLDLAAQGMGYSISSEILRQDQGIHMPPLMHINSADFNIRYYDIERDRFITVDWEYDHHETSLFQVPKMFRQPEEFRRILSTSNKYHALDVGQGAPVKRPQQMRPATGPGKNGEDLVPYLYYLRETSKEKFEIITDSLRAAFPDFCELGFPPVAAGMLTMTWKDKNFTKPLYLHELSEGSLRFLWLISLLQSSSLSAVTLIDEPDVSLHPELMHILVDLMREASERTQLIVATHSDRFVRFLEPHELKIFDLDENGCTKIYGAETLDLEKWLSEYGLGDLWTMGCLKA